MKPKIIITKYHDKIISINTNITDEFEVIVINDFTNSTMEKLDNEYEIKSNYYIDVKFTEKCHITE